jgi:hypothetical protein
VCGAAAKITRSASTRSAPTSSSSVAEYGDYLPGMGSVDLARVAQAYVRSIEGDLTGQVFAL